jgi:hypothetical protein
MLEATSATCANAATHAWGSRRPERDAAGARGNSTQGRGLWPTTFRPRSNTDAARTIPVAE